MDRPEALTRVRGRMSGDPCSPGTGVDVEKLFIDPAAGCSPDEIRADCPTLHRADCRLAIS
jgi:uncharacterized protein (DUF433 family)